MCAGKDKIGTAEGAVCQGRRQPPCSVLWHHRGGSVEDLTGNLSARVQSLSGQVSDFRAELDNVKSRLAVVESEASEFKKIVFRYESARHKKIEVELGAKASDQLWSDYLGDKFSQHRDWFERRKLGFAELALLSKGPNTPYEAGNNVAHHPEPATVSRIVGEGSESWRRLWDVACS